MYKQPYYVIRHAVNRFREVVADLPTRQIRDIIQNGLQDAKPLATYNYNRVKTSAYKLYYNGIPFLVPVTPETQKKRGEVWPVVTTILSADQSYYPFRNTWRNNGQKILPRKSR